MSDISDQLIAAEERPSGFDYLRIVLSVAVIAWHTVIVCYGAAFEAQFWGGYLRLLVFPVIPSFFALSGFLVAGSLERVKNLPIFLTLRVIRIFPALCIEVVLSALLIGPLFTELKLQEYFASAKFYAYFLNVIGKIHYYLPGVFAHNPIDKVNLQLWTIPSELICYEIITVLALLKLTRSRIAFGTAALCYNAYLYVQDIVHPIPIGFDSPTPALIISCFLWGVFLYLSRSKVPDSRWFFLTSIVLCAICLLESPQTVYLIPLPMAYATIYLGTRNPARSRLIISGDYSYGLYLYGFPIQQSVAALFPSYRLWYFNFPISIFLASLCAYSSWNFIEGPALARKRRLTNWVGGTSEFISARLAASRKLFPIAR